jgi:hypothetical protein
VVKFPVVQRKTVVSALVTEPGKISEHGGDQIAMVGIGRSQPGGI